MKVRKRISIILFCIVLVSNMFPVYAEESTGDNANVNESNSILDEEEYIQDSESNNNMKDVNNEDSAIAETGRTEITKDTEKPMLYPDTLTIDNTEANVGDIVKFSVRASDNVKLEKVIIKWINMDNNNEISWKNMIYNPKEDIYEYSLQVADTMVAGHWVVDSIGAYDTSNNNWFISYGFNSVEGGIWDFYITNDNTDSEAPFIDVSSLKVSKFEAKVGEDMVISVKATDNIGISRIRVDICYGSEVIGKTYDMYYNGITGFYEYRFKADKSNVGQSYIGGIFASDKMGNESRIGYNRYDDDAIWFIITDHEFNYNCEVINLVCDSGENVEYSYSYDKNDVVRMRILDRSIVDHEQHGTTVSNATKENSGIFTPYKEGETTVEVFKAATNEVLKVYKIKVVPKKHSACIEKNISGTFLSTTKQ